VEAFLFFACYRLSLLRGWCCLCWRCNCEVSYAYNVIPLYWIVVPRGELLAGVADEAWCVVLCYSSSLKHLTSHASECRHIHCAPVTGTHTTHHRCQRWCQASSSDCWWPEFTHLCSRKPYPAWHSLSSGKNCAVIRNYAERSHVIHFLSLIKLRRNTVYSRI
jgi:hypothetical protein